MAAVGDHTKHQKAQRRVQTRPFAVQEPPARLSIESHTTTSTYLYHSQTHQQSNLVNPTSEMQKKTILTKEIHKRLVV